jgi:hypothetical protein
LYDELTSFRKPKWQKKILERHCGETLTFTPKQKHVHVGTWLAKTHKSVALVTVFATIYDTGSLRDDAIATVYDPLLRRFPDSACLRYPDLQRPLI